MRLVLKLSDVIPALQRMNLFYFYFNDTLRTKYIFVSSGQLLFRILECHDHCTIWQGFRLIILLHKMVCVCVFVRYKETAETRLEKIKVNKWGERELQTCREAPPSSYLPAYQGVSDLATCHSHQAPPRHSLGWELGLLCIGWGWVGAEDLNSVIQQCNLRFIIPLRRLDWTRCLSS